MANSRQGNEKPRIRDDHWSGRAAAVDATFGPLESVDRDDGKLIYFKEFADAIDNGEGGGIRSLFVCCLRKWAADDAGSPHPKNWHPC